MVTAAGEAGDKQTSFLNNNNDTVKNHKMFSKKPTW